jgi:hypothetical protein
LEKELQKIVGMNSVHVTEQLPLPSSNNRDRMYEIQFNTSTGFAHTAGNLPLIVYDSSKLKGDCIQISVLEVENGTSPVSNDPKGRGFRLVIPGGSLEYPLSLHTRWLEYNESE